MGDYVSVIVYIICAIALLNLLFAIAKDDWVRSRLIRWAVLNNKVEALRLLVGCEDAYAIMSALRGPDSFQFYYVDSQYCEDACRRTQKCLGKH